MNVFEFRERAGSGVDDATEELAQKVIGAAIEVHRLIKPGMPENVYKLALAHELKLRGIPCETEVSVPIFYKGIKVEEGFIDMLVDKRLVLELKAVTALTDAHRGQAVGYLQALDLRLALLINFNVALLRNGIKRVINTYQDLQH
jgi:GxxExxY protein